MATEGPKCHLPDTEQLSGIYSGKFTERFPEVITAGKLTAVSGESVNTCLNPAPGPPTPPLMRKFRATFRPDYGKKYVFYGKAEDPQMREAEQMTHGLHVKSSDPAGKLVNPTPKSLFNQTQLNRKEALYASHQRAPLGQVRDTSKTLPHNLDKVEFVFGLASEKGGSAGELVNPNKPRLQVNDEYDSGRPLYKRSHKSWLPAEQITRSYTLPSFDPKAKYGMPTPSDSTGKAVKRNLKWITVDRGEKAAPIISKRLDDFREKTQPQLGKVHDPIKDTLLVPDNHTFGIVFKPDKMGVPDIMHMRPDCNYQRGKEREQGCVAAIRHELKIRNFHNFDSLRQAFAHYDKTNSGKISADDLREVCFQFRVHCNDTLLNRVMEYCDIDGDGLLDYNEFVNFLNWKDKPFYHATALGKEHILKPEPEDPNEKRYMSMIKQVDQDVGENKPMSAMVSAKVGGPSTKNYRCYGIPSIRSDLAIPRCRRVSDRINYGDEPNAYALVNPSVYSHRGIYEKDWLFPRSKTEVRDLFLNGAGVVMDHDSFDAAYELARSRDPRGVVTFEGFRNVLDNAQADQIRSMKNVTY